MKKEEGIVHQKWPPKIGRKKIFKKGSKGDKMR